MMANQISRLPFCGDYAWKLILPLYQALEGFKYTFFFLAFLFSIGCELEVNAGINTALFFLLLFSHQYTTWCTGSLIL